MALIEIYHVVADFYPVDPNWANDIIEGNLVKLSSTGLAIRTTVANEAVVGVAGDTQSSSKTGTPYSKALVINATGTMNNPSYSTRVTQNRVSDFYNEALASGQVTVYSGGGKFATDLYEASVSTANPMTLLYTHSTGKLTATAGSAANPVAMVVKAAGAMDAGVPGTDTANGSLSLGNYVTFKLLV